MKETYEALLAERDTAVAALKKVETERDEAKERSAARFFELRQMKERAETAEAKVVDLTKTLEAGYADVTEHSEKIAKMYSLYNAALDKIATLERSQRTPGTVEVCGWRGPVMGFMCLKSYDEARDCENKSCPLAIQPRPIAALKPGKDQ